MSIAKLSKFYNNLLMALGCTIDPDTCEVFLSYEGEDTPIYIKRRRLIAVNNKNVRNGFGDDEMAFHPLSESVTAGMSDVHQWILMAINLRLNSYLGNMAAKIANVASKPELQADLKPNEINQYKNLIDVDPKLITSVTTLVDKLDVTDRLQSFLHIRCKKSGTLNGKNYGRVTYVTFPIITELENGLLTGMVWGKPMRKKDIKALLYIFKDIILNNRTEIGDFSSGNTTTTAPYLSSILTAFNNVIMRLNSLVRSQPTVLKGLGLPTDSAHDWFPCVSDFMELQKALPQLDGNVGTSGGVPQNASKAVGRRLLEEDDNDDGDYSPSNVSGINTQVEQQHKSEPVSHNPFRALPIKGNMGAKVADTTPVYINPLMPRVVQPVAENLTVDQYMMQQTINNYAHGYNKTGNQQPVYRGRDAYSNRKQEENQGFYYTNSQQNPYYQQPQQQYYQQPQQQGIPQMVNINGQLMQVVPVQQQNQYQQPQPHNPSNGTAGMFESFAR